MESPSRMTTTPRLVPNGNGPARLVGNQAGRICQLVVSCQQRIGDSAKFSTVGVRVLILV
ncbi:hypothetical protein FHX75_12734 [Micromonospora palomenae]|uniref:Uncharacterized protein n=1 Tax=Micromonospora palomenae TaxID=1461247 RepID=A0A561WEB3_9ACTN|nr:hypothetical protein FHX75_12734 [Micromonospora palomenae]